MTHSDHLADDALSAFIDDQVSPEEASRARTHLGTCLLCQTRVDDMRALIGVLRALPSVDPPRDFRLGPRLVVDPPNVVRLRRWYAWHQR
ncbi:MAG: zf-HC2 domain-containing protein [Chloroflexi bacterium]|nr:zf-HC2 domain-containing protein [Chloroflexota bacterium]